MPREGLESVSIDEKAHEKLKKISKNSKKTMKKIVEDYINTLEVPTFE